MKIGKIRILQDRHIEQLEERNADLLRENMRLKREIESLTDEKAKLFSDEEFFHEMFMGYSQIKKVVKELDKSYLVYFKKLKGADCSGEIRRVNYEPAQK